MIIKPRHLKHLQKTISTYVNGNHPEDPFHPIVLTSIAHFIANTFECIESLQRLNPDLKVKGGELIGFAIDALRKTADEIEIKLTDLRATDKTLV